ncbi:succinate dehydrogenase cytochrome b560 subunit, mitochondrial [Elysia marginata]|uniref:Succinate dehydrogenase cytochrome b560 subunit, mitochondrial n=1 Tax=Elysia marginata TaxID=1093978 RepID=A0AAV4IYZ5_9GAST|nr:succinate dehydrogenase cytochrome b560 subunit, mitochondrial [Elysia marginata]
MALLIRSVARSSCILKQTSMLVPRRPHLAMMTSLTHRVTGVAMQVAITGASIILLCLPGDFRQNLEYVRQLSLGPAVIVAFKYVLAFPVVYHFLNGIRHLVNSNFSSL